MDRAPATDAPSVFARLDSNAAARVARVEARRNDAKLDANPPEDAANCADAFERARRESEDALRDVARDAARARTSARDDAETNEARETGKAALRAVNARVVDLDRATAEWSYFLPAYDARVMMRKMGELREQFERAVACVTPRERFRFKSRGGRATVGGAATSAATPANQTAVAMAALDLCDADDGPGTRDRRGETIVIDRATNDGEDYALERLVDCDIFVLGAIRALRAYDLRRCRVYVLAIAGSALVENIVDSVVCVATRQLRVHAARRTNFHVRATSRPIVEDSREVAFAPRFSIESPNEEEVLKAHGLFEENHMWREVDDFLWLKSSQSPHWRLLDERDRAEDERATRERFDEFRLRK